MNLGWHIGMFGVLLTFAGCPKRAMMEDRLNLDLAPMRVQDASGILSIRLAKSGAHLVLASLTRGEDHMPLATMAPLNGSEVGTPAAGVELRSPFGMPFWDLEAAQPDATVWVWTEPLSATCPLAFRGRGGAEVVLTASHPSGIYQSPRFIRNHRGGSVGITAITEGEDGPAAVVFATRDDGREVHDRVLKLARIHSPVEVLVVKHTAGFLAFVKERTPEAVRPDSAGRISERKDGRGESFQPGMLRAIRLNAALEAVGPVLQPIGDTPLFEFDADISESRAYILATTASGYLAAVGHADGDVWHWTMAAVSRPGGGLVSPAIAAGPDGIYAAAIEAAGTPSAKILAGLFQVR